MTRVSFEPFRFGHLSYIYNEFTVFQARRRQEGWFNRPSLSGPGWKTFPYFNQQCIFGGVTLETRLPSVHIVSANLSLPLFSPSLTNSQPLATCDSDREIKDKSFFQTKRDILRERISQRKRDFYSSSFPSKFQRDAFLFRRFSYFS